MRTDHSLEALNKRFEKLVLHRPEPNISAADRHLIEKKFANKSLQELNDLVLQLEDPKILYNE